ncbi:MAG: DNA gyrase subunit A [Oscillospiraceae bacterium]|nr:DNA gyrase subunit A [Oscillospiraceae bacterium]
MIHRDIEEEMRSSFLAYSMSVITSRALPDVRDGLKPVHRRILYTLFEKSLTPEKPYRKCADIVGSVLGEYHPHGDASVYMALVRLAQSFSMRYPLVDGHGNFGSIDGDPPAAYRYTEAKMTKMSVNMLTDIQKETVDFQSNYDDRLKEPTVLPARFPNLLVNGSEGIAVGMASHIPPHNLGEVIDGLDYLIENPEATLEQLMTFIKGPDFPTGGIIMGRAGIRAAYATGRGKLTVRSKTEITEIKNRQCIIVTEIPYMVNKAELIKSIAELAKEKRVDGIHDIRDESDRQGLRICIELKKDANANLVLNQLFRYTQLQDTYGVINLALVNGIPKELSLKQILEEYLNHQIDVVQRSCRFDLRKARERAHILQGFVVALDFIDEVVEIMRTSKSIPEGKQRLIERFQNVNLSTLMEDEAYRNAMGLIVDPSEKEYPMTGLSEAQAEAIVQMRLGQLTGLERDKIINEMLSLCEKINDLRDILAHRERVLGIIRDDLEEIRGKFGDERRTTIENVSGEMDIEDLIPVEDCVVTYTNFGYIKRVPAAVYKSQRRGGRGVTGMKQREEDFVSEMFVGSSHDHVLFFTNRGIMFDLKCFEIPMGGKDSKGTNIVNLLPLAENEKIAAMMKVSEFNDESYIVIVTRNGKIKRTPLPAYKNVRKNGLIAIKLDEGDEIEGVRMTCGQDQLFVATRDGMAIRVDENCIRPQGRSAHGVRIMKLRGDDEIVSMARVRAGATLLTVTEKGFGKRSEIDSYRIQNRGGFGLTNYKPDEERGKVCGIKVVDETDDIMMISSDGIIIRIRTSDIRIMGRIAKGVRVMRVSEDGRVMSFTRTEHEDDAEISEVEQLSEDELKQQEAEAAAEESAEAAQPEEPAEPDDSEETEDESDEETDEDSDRDESDGDEEDSEADED